MDELDPPETAGIGDGVEQQSTEPAFPAPNERHLARLKAKPDLTEDFDRKFGPGSAARALGIGTSRLAMEMHEDGTLDAIQRQAAANEGIAALDTSIGEAWEAGRRKVRPDPATDVMPEQAAARRTSALGGLGKLAPDERMPAAEAELATAKSVEPVARQVADTVKAGRESLPQALPAPRMLSLAQGPARLADAVTGLFGAYADEQKKRVDHAEQMVRGDAELPQHAVWRASLDKLAQSVVDFTAAKPVEAAAIWGSEAINQTGLTKIDPLENPVYRFGKRIEDWAKDKFPDDKGRQYEFSGKVAQGLGSTAAFGGTGLLVRMMGAGERGMMAAIALSGAAGNVPDEFEKATKAIAAGTATEQDRFINMLANSALGMTEALPFAPKIAKPGSAGVGAAVRRAGEQMIEEGGQEFGQQLGTNIAAKKTFDPNRDPYEGVLEGLAVAGLTGGAFGAGMSRATGRAERDNEARSAAIKAAQAAVRGEEPGSTSTVAPSGTETEPVPSAARPDLPASSTPTKRTDADIARAPGFNDMLAALPKDANGDPDLEPLVQRISEHGAKAWGQLTPEQRATVYQTFKPIAEAVQAAVPALAGAFSPEQQTAIDAENARRDAAREQKPWTPVAPNQPITAADATQDARAKFDEVLASKLARKDWGKATGVPEARLKTLIDDAVKDGRLKMVRGQPRRTGKKVAAPAKAAPAPTGNEPAYAVPIIPTFQRLGPGGLAKQLAAHSVDQIREMARVQGVRPKQSANDKASVVAAVIEAVKANRAGVAAAAGGTATNQQILDAAKQSGRLEVVTVGDKPKGPLPVPGTLGAVRPGQDRAQQFREQLISTGFKTITEARTAAKAAGITETGKALDEYIETAIVDAARQMAASGKAPGETYNDLVGLYNRQPNLGVRTSTSVANQAYSTPMPLAYLASRLAGVSESNVVYEPTAGNGALLIEADPAKQTVYANEIEAGRAAALAAQGFRTSSVDGADPKQAARIRSAEAAGSVIMNPPFGAVRDKGKSKTFEVGGWATTQIDHAIALQALNAMADDGKAVLILGGVKAESVEERRKGYRGQAKREFYARLYGQYNVTDHFTVSGDLYAKQGASWPVDVVVIDGRGKSARTLPAASPPTIFDSWDALAEKLPDGEVRRPVDGQADGADPAIGQPDAGDAGGVEPTAGGRSGELPAGTDDQPARVRGGRDRGQPAGPRGASSQPGVPEQPGRPRDAGATDQPAAPRHQRVKRETKGGQAQYEPASNAVSLDTLIPVNMAGAAQAALRRVEERHGPVDALVADRLGYAPETLSNYFSAEQVDAIAAAIDNVERGAAFILGDQTGIGKGRVVAGMLRYAMRRQLVPVLVTEKPDLYGDMYRDLRDIGIEEMLGREPRMFMTNSGESVTLDEAALEWKQEVETARAQGKKAPAKRGKFLTGPAGAKQLDDMRAVVNGEDRYDVVFTTYDQMNTVRGADTPRRQFLGQLGPRAMIAFDESHNAGGAAKTGWESKNRPINRADFARDLAKNAAGVIFSSATYAKRPDVMDLYARTDMGKAVDDPKQLPDLIQRGGVPMQQIVATMLSDSGQYMRRERSFDGIEYAVEPVPVDADTYRQFSEAIRAVFKFDLAVKDVRKDLMEDLLDAKGMAQSKDSGVGEGAAHTTSFSSIMHNIVGQMLLAIKAKATAARAIEAHRAGEKPIIALANTNESFIKDFAEQEGIAIGEAIELDFGDVLRRYLGRTLRVTIKSAEGEKEHVQIPVSDLPGDLQTAYADALAMIDSGAYEGLPISPIDAIRNGLAMAGMSVAEVTGRQTMIDYSGETASYVARPRKEQGPSGKRASIAAFNAGRLDALILNRSGSTGVSMHASEKFKDQRKRRMILAQAEANIDTHLQMLGRVHRTGQVIPPAYSQVAAEIPAEARPTAVLMRKMASLNANTTGARGSVFMAESVDFMNEVGDKVVWEYLRENPEIEDELGGDILKVGDDGLPSWVDAAKRATGRLVLLPPEKQSEFLEAVQSEYKAALEELDALGENPLEAKTVDLQARMLESTELKPSTGEGPFLAASAIEKVSVKSSGRAMAMPDVLVEVAKSLEVTAPTGEPTAAMTSLIDKGREWATKNVAAVEARTEQWLKSATADMEGDAKAKFEEREREALDRLTSTMQIVYPGSRVSVAMPAGELNGIVLSAERTGKAKSPTAGGSWTVTIAVPDSMRVLKLSMAKLFPPSTKMELTDKGARVFRSSLSFSEIAAELDKARLEGRETRYVVTGNILAGFDQVNGKGQIVNFTAEDGSLRPGILMGRDFRQDKFMSSRAVRFASGEHVAAFLDEAPNATVKSSDGNVIISQRYGEYKIETPASRATGGRYYTDPAVRDALGANEFVKSGNRMFARPNRAQMIRAVDAIKAAGALLETTANQEVAQKLAPKPTAEPAKAAKAEPPPLPPGTGTPSVTEIVERRKDRSYAMGANGISDGLEQMLATRDLEMGRKWRLDDETAAKMREAIKNLPKILPNGYQPSFLRAAFPQEGGAISAVFERLDGKFVALPISVADFSEVRAVTFDDGGIVGFFRFDTVSNFSNTLGVELWHEAIHALRRVNALNDVKFSELVAHAKKLRVLETKQKTFRRALGDPQWQDGQELTIGEIYTALYAGRENLAAMLDEEAVAHMTELLVAGVPLPLPENIRRIYADIESGRLASGTVEPAPDVVVEPAGTGELQYRIGDYLWRTSIDTLADRLGAVPVTKLRPWSKHRGPVLAFHGTTVGFETFDADAAMDVAHHFGTPDIANKFAIGETFRGDVSEEPGRVIPVVLDIRNPVTLPDLGDWEPSIVVRSLIEASVPVPDELVRLADVIGPDSGRRGFNTKLREHLISLGYDGIRYLNAVEGRGMSWSYIAIAPGTVTSALHRDVMYAMGAASQFSPDAVRDRERTHALAVHYDAVPVAEMGPEAEHPGRVVVSEPMFAMNAPRGPAVISAERAITLAGPAPTDPAALRQAIVDTGVEMPELPTVEAIHQHLSANGYGAIRHHDPATGWQYAVWEPANVIGADVDPAAVRAEMAVNDARAAAMEAEDLLELSTPVATVKRNGTASEPMYAFGGVKAKGAPTSVLTSAMKMEARGRTADHIRETTGWFKGPDQKWRFEIDDSKAKVVNLDKHISKPENTLFRSMLGMPSKKQPKWVEGKVRIGANVMLSDILKHDALYKHYPFLLKMRANIMVGPGIPKDRAGGSLTIRRGDGKISFAPIAVRSRTEADVLATLMHEIQHYIQEKEGFATGSAPSDRDAKPPNATLDFSKKTDGAIRYQGRTFTANALAGAQVIDPSVPLPVSYAEETAIYLADLHEMRDGGTKTVIAKVSAGSVSTAPRAIVPIEEEIGRTQAELVQMLTVRDADYVNSVGEGESVAVEERLGLTAAQRRSVPVKYGFSDNTAPATPNFGKAADEVLRRAQIFRKRQRELEKPQEIAPDIVARSTRSGMYSISDATWEGWGTNLNIAIDYENGRAVMEVVERDSVIDDDMLADLERQGNARPRAIDDARLTELVDAAEAFFRRMNLTPTADYRLAPARRDFTTGRYGARSEMSAQDFAFWKERDPYFMFDTPQWVENESKVGEAGATHPDAKRIVGASHVIETLNRMRMPLDLTKAHLDAEVWKARTAEHESDDGKADFEKLSAQKDDILKEIKVLGSAFEKARKDFDKSQGSQQAWDAMLKEHRAIDQQRSEAFDRLDDVKAQITTGPLRDKMEEFNRTRQALITAEQTGHALLEAAGADVATVREIAKAVKKSGASEDLGSSVAEIEEWLREDLKSGENSNLWYYGIHGVALPIIRKRIPAYAESERRGKVAAAELERIGDEINAAGGMSPYSVGRRIPRRRADTMFAFGGPKAKTADIEALSRAEQLEASGPKIGQPGYEQHRTMIWNQTGWFRGTDQKWRYEIDDSGASLRKHIEVGGQYKADEAVRNTLLFRAYPALRDLMVYTTDDAWSSFSGTGDINLGMTTDDPTSVALHEMQHATQQIEGFARGGSMQQFGPGAISSERENISPAAAGFLSDTDIAFRLYSRLAGEVEARTVERRRLMTPAERRALPPWISADTDEDLQLVRFRADENGVEQSVDPRLYAPDIIDSELPELPDGRRAMVHGSAAKVDRLTTSTRSPEFGPAIFLSAPSQAQAGHAYTYTVAADLSPDHVWDLSLPVPQNSETVQDALRSLGAYRPGGDPRSGGALRAVEGLGEDLGLTLTAAGIRALRNTGRRARGPEYVVFDESLLEIVETVDRASQPMFAMGALAKRNDATLIDDIGEANPHPGRVLGLHGTREPAAADRFDISQSSDFGIHVGTVEQAHSFSAEGTSRDMIAEAAGRSSQTGVSSAEYTALSKMYQTESDAAAAAYSDAKTAIERAAAWQNWWRKRSLLAKAQAALQVAKAKADARDTALRRVSDLSTLLATENGLNIPVVLDVRNPIDMPDMGAWHFANVIDKIRYRLDITDEERSRIVHLGESEDGHALAAEELRGVLIRNGFDSIRYPNKAEGEGWSYIAIKPDTVRSATSGQVMFAFGGGSSKWRRSGDSIAASIEQLKDATGMTVIQGLRGIAATRGDGTARMIPGDGKDRGTTADGRPRQRFGNTWIGGRRIEAQYDNYSGVARMRSVRRLDETAHEAAHHLERIVGAPLLDLQTQFGAELDGMAVPGLADTRSEQWAEWFRLYITNPAAAQLAAPGLYDAFEDMLDGEMPGMLGKLEEVQQMIATYGQQSPLNQVASDLVAARHRNIAQRAYGSYRDGTLAGDISVAMSLLYTAGIATTNPFWKVTSELLSIADRNGIRDANGKPISLRVTENPEKVFRAFAGSYKKGHNWLMKGIRDTDGSEVAPPLRDALVKVFGAGSESGIGSTAAAAAAGVAGAVVGGPVGAVAAAIAGSALYGKATDRMRNTGWDTERYQKFNAYVMATAALERYRQYEEKQSQIADLNAGLAQAAQARPGLVEAAGKTRAMLERRKMAATRIDTLLKDRKRTLGTTDTEVRKIAQQLDAKKDDVLAAQMGRDAAVAKRRDSDRQALEKRQQEAVREAEAIQQEVDTLEVQQAIVESEIDQLTQAADIASQRVEGLDEAVRQLRAVRERELGTGIHRPPVLEVKDKLQQTVEEAERLFPEFVDAARIFHEYVHGLLVMEYRAGFHSPEQFAALAANKDWYAPLMRDLSDIRDAKYTGSQMGGKWQQYQALKGSDRAVLNPVDVIIERSYALARKTAYDAGVKSLVSLVQRAGPGAGAIAEEVTREEAVAASQQTFDRIAASAKALGMDDTEAANIVHLMEHELTGSDLQLISTPTGKGSPKPALQVPYWENGERKMLRINDAEFAQEIFDSINGIGEDLHHWLVKTVAAPSRWLSFGVTAHPAFAIVNMARDMMAAWMTTGATPVYTQAKGIAMELSTHKLFDSDAFRDWSPAWIKRKVNDWQEFVRAYHDAGGIRGGQFAASLGDVKDKADWTGLRRDGFNIEFRRIWDVIELSETSTRLGVARMAFKRAKAFDPTITDTEAIAEAAFTARDVLDFDRRGSKMAAFTRIVAFLNPNLQGMDKAIRSGTGSGDRGSAIKRKMQIVMKRDSGIHLSANEERDLVDAYKFVFRVTAFNAAVIAVYLLHAGDPEEEEITDRMKQSHVMIDVANIWHNFTTGKIGQILGLSPDDRKQEKWQRAPLPFELATPAVVGIWALRTMADKDPEAYARLWETLHDLLAPPVVPQLWKIMGEPAANFSSFTGRQIVSADLQKLDPSQRYEWFTSTIAKNVGAALNVAPIKVDYIITNGLGYMGREIQRYGEWLLPGGRQRPGQDEDMLTKRVKADPYKSSNVMTEFYKQMKPDGGGGGPVGIIKGIIVHDGAQYVQAASGYKKILDEQNPIAAKTWLAQKPEEMRAYATLMAHFNTAAQNIHPINRLDKVVTVINRMQREILNGELKDAVGARRRRNLTLESVLKPSLQDEEVMVDILNRVKVSEARNTFIVIGHGRWGGSGQKQLPTDLVLDELKTANPAVYDEFTKRIQMTKVPSLQGASEAWKKAKPELLREQENAGIPDYGFDGNPQIGTREERRMKTPRVLAR